MWAVCVQMEDCFCYLSCLCCGENLNLKVSCCLTVLFCCNCCLGGRIVRTWRTLIPLALRGFILRVTLSLTVSGHAYMSHTIGMKGLLRHTTPYGFNTAFHKKVPQWNFSALLESVTHKISVCLLPVPDKLGLTLFSSESSKESYVRMLFAKMEVWPCFECHISHMLLSLMSWLKYFPLEIPKQASILR